MTIRSGLRIPVDQHEMERQFERAATRDAGVAEVLNGLFLALQAAEDKLDAGNAADAIRDFRSVAEIARKHALPELESFCWGEVAHVTYNVTFDARGALEAFERLAARTRQPEIACLSHNCMASLHITSGDTRSAIRCSERTISLSSGVQDDENRAILRTIATHNIGEAHFASGNLAKAKQHIEKAAVQFRSQSNEAAVAKGEAMLGAIATSEEQPERAIELLQRSLGTFLKLGNREEIAETKKLLSTPLVKLGRFNEAIQLLREAATLHRERGELTFAANALVHADLIGQLKKAAKE